MIQSKGSGHLKIFCARLLSFQRQAWQAQFSILWNAKTNLSNRPYVSPTKKSVSLANMEKDGMASRFVAQTMRLIDQRRWIRKTRVIARWASRARGGCKTRRSEEHTSELQSPDQIVCRIL